MIEVFVPERPNNDQKTLEINNFIAWNETYKQRKHVGLLNYIIKIFQKVQTKAERTPNWLMYFPWFHWLTGWRCVPCFRFRQHVLDFFGWFRMSDFALGRWARRVVCASLCKFVWAKFRNANLLKARTDCTVFIPSSPYSETFLFKRDSENCIPAYDITAYSIVFLSTLRDFPMKTIARRGVVGWETTKNFKGLSPSPWSIVAWILKTSPYEATA
jgi:hypothetical protein